MGSLFSCKNTNVDPSLSTSALTNNIHRSEEKITKQKLRTWCLPRFFHKMTGTVNVKTPEVLAITSSVSWICGKLIKPGTGTE